MAEVINGRQIADEVLANCARKAEYLNTRFMRPNLCFVIVGDNPASHLYVRYKAAACKKINISSNIINHPNDADTATVINSIFKLNHDEYCHGILVQLPLPSQLDTDAVLAAVNPNKDVDGLHPLNQGLTTTEQELQPMPCTPLAILHILKVNNIDFVGKVVTIIGRSRIVGKSLALLLINQGATVRVCNSHTKDLQQECLGADILVVAAGCPKLVTKEMVKPGAVVIDVGITRTEDNKVVGDVDFEQVKQVARMITPVPNGVGPLTVAMLMQNTVTLAEQQVSKI